LVLLYASTHVDVRLISYSKGKEKAKALSASPVAASYIPSISFSFYNSSIPFRPSPLPAETVDIEAQSEELVLGSDVDEKVGELTSFDEELHVIPLYLWFSAHISYSMGALSSEEVADADDAEMKARDSGEKNGKDDRRADNSADHLSVMYLPCQDPMLAKIYQGLPALPCVAA
jgi:hypothetical protein